MSLMAAMGRKQTGSAHAEWLTRWYNSRMNDRRHLWALLALAVLAFAFYSVFARWLSS
jgi:hypothetical protein